MYLAIAMVVIMVASAFAMMPLGAKSKASDDNSAKAAIGGTRSIKYEIYDIGESYLKPTVYSMLGRHDHTKSGINQWFTPRWVGYNDTTIRNQYPYVVSYDPYSANLATGNPKYTKASWTTHSFYTLKMDAKNIEGIASGVGGVAADPWFLPIMAGGASPQTLPGGWANMSMYLTYLTEQEYADIAAGTHYANTHYGVVGSDINNIWQKFYANDGWMMEAQGHFDFNVLAAKKFLGLPGTDLVAEFNSNIAAITTAWRAEWIADGDAGMPLDIYAAYDFSLMSGNGPVYIVLKLDAAASSPSKLAIWFWSLTWGAESLHTRYLWKTGITEELQPYMEDWYLNATFAPTMGDLYSKMTTAYHMTMWKDPDFWNPAWIIEPQNMDYTADNGADPYVSYFDNYFCSYWGTTYKPLRRCWVPGMDDWGADVHFWQTPMAWNLDQYESLSIKLPTDRPGWGIKPYLSTNFTSGSGVQLPGASAPEQYSNGLWGEWVLGHGRPAADIYSLTYYNPTTKTLSWTGPKTFTSWEDEVYNSVTPGPGGVVLEAGTPFVVMDIARVSHFKLDVLGTLAPGVPLTLQVTPLNYTMVQAFSNQTVVLPAVSGVTYGATTHKFAYNETSWNTTVTFAAAGPYNLVSQDQYFYLDVVDTYQVTIPSGGGFQMTLVAGWNLVSVPVTSTLYRASTLGLKTNDIVAGWNPSSQTYDKTYIVGVSLPFKDFNIEPNTGYWIMATQVEPLTLSGTPPSGAQSRLITVPGPGSWAIVGINTLRIDMKASDLVVNYTGGFAISQVVSYNAATGQYKTYNPMLPFTNYYLVPGQGYWIMVTGSGTLNYVA